MKRKIAVIGENPEKHGLLFERLHAAGFDVLPKRNSELPALLRGEEETFPAAIVYDFSSPERPAPDPCIGLGRRRPELLHLFFCPSFPDLRPAGGIGPWKELSGAHVFEQPLADPGAFRLIEEAMALTAPSLSPGAAASDALRDGVVQKRQKEIYPYSEEFLRRVGASNVPVLLHGETGVGKEVMARRIWSYSSRAAKPFLKLNCAALPSELIESELFGYEKGAFTGANIDKPGKFELAQNGTILLDEIGDMDIRLQAKLLQVLQDGEVQPLGSSRIISVNVRVMAATHRDLRTGMEQGSFREDLYYRLSVINMTIPPLRDRRHEILPLAEQLLRRHLSPPGSEPPAISDRLRQAMLSYQWPGNVRELENVMRRLLVYQDAELLSCELAESPSLRGSPKGIGAERSAPASSSQAPLNGKKIDYLARASREAEYKLLLETLDAVRWNRRQAAARLNVDYKAFLYKLQKHGIVKSKAKRGKAES